MFPGVAAVPTERFGAVRVIVPPVGIHKGTQQRLQQCALLRREETVQRDHALRTGCEHEASLFPLTCGRVVARDVRQADSFDLLADVLGQLAGGPERNDAEVVRIPTERGQRGDVLAGDDSGPQESGDHRELAHHRSDRAPPARFSRRHSSRPHDCGHGISRIRQRGDQHCRGRIDLTTDSLEHSKPVFDCIYRPAHGGHCCHPDVIPRCLVALPFLGRG